MTAIDYIIISELHIEGEAKVVWTRGTDNRLVLEERRERAGM